MKTKEAAVKLGVSPNQVRYLLAKGELEGTKSGRDWIVLDLKGYERERVPKIKRTGAKISPKQIELLEALNNGWQLKNYSDFRENGWGRRHGTPMDTRERGLPRAKSCSRAGPKPLLHQMDGQVYHAVPMLQIYSPMGIRNNVSLRRKVRVQEIEAKHYDVTYGKGVDLYWAESPDKRSPITFRNVTIYRLEYEGLIQENEGQGWSLTDKGKQVLKEQP